MSQEPIKVLLVEDNAGDARLVREIMSQTQPCQLQFIHHERLSAALDHLANDRTDVVLLDLSLPDAHGLESVNRTRAAAPDVPLVVLTSLNDEALAVQALQVGAQDYLVKGQIDANLVLRALRYAIERHRVQSALHNLALLDDLTSLHNRRGFLLLAEQHLKLARRTCQAFLIVFVDLDSLKQINDTFGHAEGNQTLVEAANLLREICRRQSDILARLGGDEFAILMPEASESNIDTVKKRLQKKLDSHNGQPNRRYQLSLSMGILPWSPGQPYSLEELLSQADALMYEQKRNKRTLA